MDIMKAKGRYLCFLSSKIYLIFEIAFDFFSTYGTMIKAKCKIKVKLYFFLIIHNK